MAIGAFSFTGLAQLAMGVVSSLPHCQCSLTEVEVYSRALTAGEVYNSYARGAGLVC